MSFFWTEKEFQEGVFEEAPPIPKGEFLIVVEVEADGEATIIEAPDGLCEQWLDQCSYGCEDSGLDHWPTEPGLWENPTAEFWYDRGDPYALVPTDDDGGISVDPAKWTRRAPQADS